MNIHRIIDAEINRISEGIRVLEDIARFSLENKDLSSRLRTLRHSARKSIASASSLSTKSTSSTLSTEALLQNRDSKKDIGLPISQKGTLDNKNNLKDIITANFKRIQEGLRSLEENLKLLNQYDLSKIYENLRFDAYSLEKDFIAELHKYKRFSCLDTDIYGITGSKFSKGRSNEEVVSAMIKAGIKIIQYREKEKTLKEKLEECIKIRQLTRDTGVTFIVNDDITVAQIVDADGIHLGQDDFPLHEVRNIVGEKMILGLSTHSPEQARKAVEIGADYIGVGPIYKTYTKDNVCDPVGHQYLEWVVENIKLPFVAIGGIKIQNIDEIVKRGVKCIAMVTEIVGADDIEKTVSQIRKKITANGR